MQSDHSRVIQVTLLLAWMFIIIPVTGCQMISQATNVQNDSRWDLAEAQVDTLMNSFIEYRKDAFSEQVDPSFCPVRSIFVNAADQAFAQNVIHDLDYSVDSVLTENNKLFVSITWHKKQTPRNEKKQEIIKGKSGLVFVQRDGVYRLLKVKGENPFV